MITVKKAEGDFKVLNLTDIHIIPEYWETDNEICRLYKRTVKTLVERLKPNLITVSGDLSFADFGLSTYENHAKFLGSFGIPWTVTLGNHDNQDGDETSEKIIEIFKTDKNFVFEECDVSLGRTNFVIGIEENKKVVHGIFIMDTHEKIITDDLDENGNKKWYWDKLHPEQLTWYEQKINELKEKGCNNTSIITHIPIYGYNDAFKAASKEGVDVSEIPVSEIDSADIWNEGYNASGINYERICSYIEDEGMLDLIVKLGSTKLCLCGHDHVNNSSITYRGVNLMYGLKTGMGCYWKEGMNGGTLLSIDSEGNITPRHEFVK